MSKGNKFVIILMILAFLANEGIISQSAPEDYIKDIFGLSFLEDIGTWSSHFNPQNPIWGLLELLWILFKHFWTPAIIALLYSYIKERWDL